MSTFTKKVGCAALSCRKVFLLAAVAAMAFGAQAETYQYTFQFELKNIPEQNPDGRPDHTMFFLVDTKHDNKVLVWLSRDELTKSLVDEKWALDSNKVNPAHVSGSNPGYEALKEYSKFEAHTLINATITKTGTGDRDRSVQVTFTTDKYIFEDLDVYWSPSGESGETRDLLAIATNGDDSSITCVEYKTDDNGIIGLTSSGGYAYGLEAGAGYTNVPEPTSAMLLLLGVAGLALRRKVA